MAISARRWPPSIWPREDGLAVHAETLRRWMGEAGLWRRARRRKPYRQRREAKAHFGELVQLDGSFHEWLEERGPRGCLMHMVDDATSTASGQFSAEETIWAAVGVLRRVDRALRGSARAVHRLEERRMCGRDRSRRACAGKASDAVWAHVREAGHRIIAASSPQAKGRVERAHGTHQDRLVKKLRLAGIAGYDDANRYLRRALYRRTQPALRARPAAEAADYHRRRPTARQLDEVFWLEEERVVSEDWVVRYKNRLLQLQRQSRAGCREEPGAGAGKRSRRSGDSLSRARVCVFREGRRASTARSQGRGAAPSPAPPSPNPNPASDADHPWRKESISEHEDADLFLGMVKLQPGDISIVDKRGHFYCGMTKSFFGV